MDRLKILHIINSLGNGGTENLLKYTLEVLPEHEHIVLFLSGPDQMSRDLEKRGVRFFCLHHPGWSGLFSSLKKMRQLIREIQPSLVHAHLLESTLLARLATPRNIPLVFSIHSIYSIDAFSKNKKSLWAEKLTVRKRQTLVAVSQTVLDDYLHFVPFSGRRFVLYNFLPDHYFNRQRARPSPSSTLSCVAVGNLKAAKNYHYLLDCFAHLKDQPITLDIYGAGDQQQELQQRIDGEKLAVQLRGSAGDVLSVFPGYDLFVQASLHEGFGLSVIEAIASGLPVALSDIKVFHEITNGQAHFFPLDNSAACARLLLQLQQDQTVREKYADAAFDHCRAKYSEKAYRRQLLEIYKVVTSPAHQP